MKSKYIKKPYSDEERLKIKEMLNAEVKPPEIAIALGRTINSILAEIARQGGKKAYNPWKLFGITPKKPFSKEDRITIQSELEKGSSVRYICHLLNRTVGSLRHEIKSNGGMYAYNAHNAENGWLTSMPKNRLFKKDFNTRLENIEFQLEIITQTLQEILNGKNN